MSKETLSNVVPPDQVLAEFLPPGAGPDRFKALDQFNSLNDLSRHYDTAKSVAKRTSVAVPLAVGSALIFSQPAAAKELTQAVEKLGINSEPTNLGISLGVGAIASLIEVNQSADPENYGQILGNGAWGLIIGYLGSNTVQDAIHLFSHLDTKNLKEFFSMISDNWPIIKAYGSFEGIRLGVKAIERHFKLRSLVQEKASNMSARRQQTQRLEEIRTAIDKRGKLKLRDHNDGVEMLKKLNPTQEEIDIALGKKKR